MRLRVLGCHSGESPSHRPPCFWLDDDVLLDAGSVTRALSLAAQSSIAHVLLSRARFDHSRDLAHLLANTFASRTTPLTLHSSQPILNALATHVFNNVIAPDFTQLPSQHAPALAYAAVSSHTPHSIGALNAVFVPAEDRQDMVIQSSHGALGYLGGQPSPLFFETLERHAPVRALIVAVPFTNATKATAQEQHALTPQLLAEALELWHTTSLRLRILVSHLPAHDSDTLRAELLALRDSRITVLRPMDEFEL